MTDTKEETVFDVEKDPALEQTEKAGLALREESRAITLITSENDYEAIASKRRTAKAVIKATTDYLEPHITAAHSKHKRLTALRARLLGPYNDVVSHVNTIILNYEREQERIRKEAERKAQELARKEAEDRQIAEAEALEEAGQPEAAEAALIRPVTPHTVNISRPNRPSGISTSKKWRAEVVDLSALVKAVAEGKAPLSYLEANTKKLNQAALAQGDEMNVPGVRVYEDMIVSGR